jgi:hypothetical protein
LWGVLWALRRRQNMVERVERAKMAVFLCAILTKLERFALNPLLLLFITPVELSFEKQCKYVSCSA